jgi:hypothetical protein
MFPIKLKKNILKRFLQVNRAVCSLPCNLLFGLSPQNFVINIDKGANGQIAVKTNFALQILFQTYFLQIKLDDSYLVKVCGLCGNFSNNRTDDLTERNGTLTTDVNAFGLSWKNADPK